MHAATRSLSKHSRSTLSTLAIVTTTVALALPWVSAHAQDKSNRTLALGNGPPTGKTLTKEQLRQCLQLQPDLTAQGEQAMKSRNELDSTKAEFDKVDGQLQSQKSGLNASDKAAVDAYNALIDKRRQLMNDYEAKRPMVTEQAQRFDATRKTWKSDCENRPYKEDDYESIPHGK